MKLRAGDHIEFLLRILQNAKNGRRTATETFITPNQTESQESKQTKNFEESLDKEKG